MPACDDLDSLEGLQRPDDTRDRAEDAQLRTRADGLWCRRARKETTKTRSIGLQAVRSKLAVELLRCPADERSAETDRGVGEEVARGEVIGAIQDDIIRCEQRQRVGGGQRVGDGLDAHAGVDSADRVSGVAEEREGRQHCWMAAADETAFGVPSLDSVWRTWRCKLDSSTTSWSTMPMRPV